MYQLEVVGAESGVRVPPVDLTEALVPEEESSSSIGAQHHDLGRLDAHVMDLTSRGSAMEELSLDGEEVVAGQVREEQGVAATRFPGKSDVQDILSGTALRHGFGEDQPEATGVEDIVDDDGAVGGIGDVREDAAVGGVFDQEILETAVGAGEGGEINNLEDLAGLDVYGDDLRAAATDGLLQGIDDADV